MTCGNSNEYITKLTLAELKEMKELPVNFSQEDLYVRSLTEINGIKLYDVDRILVSVSSTGSGAYKIFLGVFEIYNKDTLIGKIIFGENVVVELDSYWGSIRIKNDLPINYSF